MNKTMATVFLAIALVSPAWAATYYTAKNGSDGNAGLTTEVPFASVTKGVSVLAPGDTLLVRAGTYAEALINNVPSGTSWGTKVRIAAYTGEKVTLTPEPAPDYVVLFSGNQQYIEFDGINMDGKNATYGAVKIEGWANGNPHHIRIKNAEIQASVARETQGIILDAQKAGIIGGNEFINLKIHSVGGNDFSHGIYIKSSNNLVERCNIYDFPGGGVHIYNASYPMTGNIVRNNVIHDGRKTASGQRHWGVIVADGSKDTQVYNNIVFRIPKEGASSAGILTLYSQTNTGIANNTVYGNAGQGIEIAHASATGTQVKNNISYGNSAGDYSDLGSGTVAASNLFSVDPQFVDAAAGNFKLKSTSPAKDAGTTLPVVTTDIAYLARPSGSYDIGAYEYGEAETVPPPPSTDPIASWKLDQTSGSSATDSSGNNHTGTLLNGPTWVTGRVGGALSLDGSDDAVEIAGLLGSPQSLTLSSWANLTKADSEGATVISLGNYVGVRLDDFNNEAAGFYFNGTSWNRAGFAAKYAGTGWHHFAYTLDGSAHKQTLYIDGVSKATSAFTEPIVYTGLGTATYLGRQGSGGTTYDFNGKLDEAQVYNRSLSAAEVQALVNVPSPCAEVATASAPNFWKELSVLIGYLGYFAYALIIFRRR